MGFLIEENESLYPIEFADEDDLNKRFKQFYDENHNNIGFFDCINPDSPVKIGSIYQYDEGANPTGGAIFNKITHRRFRQLIDDYIDQCNE